MERFCTSCPEVLLRQGAVQEIRSGCWMVITFFVHTEICYVASIINKDMVISHHVLRGCHIPFQMPMASGLVPSCRIFPGMGTHDLGFSLRSTLLCPWPGNLRCIATKCIILSPQGRGLRRVLLYSRELPGSTSLPCEFLQLPKMLCLFTHSL